jgi:hypothetical protein
VKLSKMLLLLSAIRDTALSSGGLFMSAASANVSDIALQQYLRSGHFACSAPWNISSSPSFISSVAIQSVGDGRNGGALYTTALDAMLPALQCIPQLYIGTTIPHGADFYCSDVLNLTYTAEAIATSAAAARAFVDRYEALLVEPLEFAWYISPEQFLNHFAEGCSPKLRENEAAAVDIVRSNHITSDHISAAQLASAWGDFLRAWTQALAAVRPGTRILWSPAAPESPVRGSNTR